MEQPHDPVRVAVVGAGYWGINLVRVFGSVAGAELLWVCERERERWAAIERVVPGIRTTDSFDDLLRDETVEAVVLATPAVAHVNMTLQALAAGKHVLVEKPLALNRVEAERVRDEARSRERLVMVGHLMVYHPVVRRLKKLLTDGELGELYYLYSQRTNLGKLRHDENALWSLGPHDLSIIDFLLAAAPESVTARGDCYLQPGIEDVVFVSLKFSSGEMAHVHLSWLDPRKERRVTLVGSKKMAEFDDVAADKLRIYDKGYETPPRFTRFEQYLTIRHGDVHIPHVELTEPLSLECRAFLDSIRTGEAPPSDIESAIRVTRVLEAAQKSLNLGGVPVEI